MVYIKEGFKKKKRITGNGTSEGKVTSQRWQAEKKTAREKKAEIKEGSGNFQAREGRMWVPGPAYLTTWQWQGKIKL